MKNDPLARWLGQKVAKRQMGRWILQTSNDLHGCRKFKIYIDLPLRLNLPKGHKKLLNTSAPKEGVRHHKPGPLRQLSVKRSHCHPGSIENSFKTNCHLNIMILKCSRISYNNIISWNEPQIGTTFWLFTFPLFVPFSFSLSFFPGMFQLLSAPRSGQPQLPIRWSFTIDIPIFRFVSRLDPCQTSVVVLSCSRHFDSHCIIISSSSLARNMGRCNQLIQADSDGTNMYQRVLV